jgi:hypothetical protein
MREDDTGRIVGITHEGQFFIHRLRLNRPQLIAYRTGLRARQQLREELAAALDQVGNLERRMDELGVAIDSAADDLEGD